VRVEVAGRGRFAVTSALDVKVFGQPLGLIFRAPGAKRVRVDGKDVKFGRQGDRVSLTVRVPATVEIR
jgi:hypothetical protein